MDRIRDFLSFDIGSIPIGGTKNGDVDYRLGRSPIKAKDKVQVLTSLLNGVIY